MANIPIKKRPAYAQSPGTRLARPAAGASPMRGQQASRVAQVDPRAFTAQAVAQSRRALAAGERAAVMGDIGETMVDIAEKERDMRDATGLMQADIDMQVFTDEFDAYRNGNLDETQWGDELRRRLESFTQAAPDRYGLSRSAEDKLKMTVEGFQRRMIARTQEQVSAQGIKRFVTTSDALLKNAVERGEFGKIPAIKASRKARGLMPDQASEDLFDDYVVQLAEHYKFSDMIYNDPVAIQKAGKEEFPRLSVDEFQQGKRSADARVRQLRGEITDLAITSYEAGDPMPDEVIDSYGPEGKGIFNEHHVKLLKELKKTKVPVQPDGKFIADTWDSIFAYDPAGDPQRIQETNLKIAIADPRIPEEMKSEMESAVNDTRSVAATEALSYSKEVVDRWWELDWLGGQYYDDAEIKKETDKDKRAQMSEQSRLIDLERGKMLRVINEHIKTQGASMEGIDDMLNRYAEEYRKRRPVNPFEKPGWFKRNLWYRPMLGVSPYTEFEEGMEKGIAPPGAINRGDIELDAQERMKQLIGEPTLEGGTVGMRNNNYGNVKKPGGATWKGTTGYDRHGHAVFDEPENGVRAFMLNLKNQYSAGKFKSINDLIGYYTHVAADRPGYIEFIAKETGIGPDMDVRLLEDGKVNKRVMFRLAKAMMEFENGRDPGLTDELLKEGYRRAF